MGILTGAANRVASDVISCGVALIGKPLGPLVVMVVWLLAGSVTKVDVSPGACITWHSKRGGDLPHSLFVFQNLELWPSYHSALSGRARPPLTRH